MVRIMTGTTKFFLKYVTDLKLGYTIKKLAIRKNWPSWRHPAIARVSKGITQKCEYFNFSSSSPVVKYMSVILNPALLSISKPGNHIWEEFQRKWGHNPWNSCPRSSKFTSTNPEARVMDSSAVAWYFDSLCFLFNKVFILVFTCMISCRWSGDHKYIPSCTKFE